MREQYLSAKDVGSALSETRIPVKSQFAIMDALFGEREEEPNQTPCPVCGTSLGWGRRTPFGIYDEASALLNHIESQHPEVEL